MMKLVVRMSLLCGIGVVLESCWCVVITFEWRGGERVRLYRWMDLIFVDGCDDWSHLVKSEA